MHPAVQPLRPLIGIAALLLGVPAWAMSAPTIEAAQVVLSQVNTLAPCPSFCGGHGGRAAFMQDGGSIGATTSFASLTNADGSSQAQASLNGPTELPVLKAEAYSSPGAIGGSLVSAGAAGMQGFFVGAGGLASYQLGVQLTGIATDIVRATVVIFRDRDPSTAPGFSSDPGTMIGEVIALAPDLELFDQASLYLSSDGTLQTATGQLSTSALAEGQLFYVWASLETRGLRGTSGDAFDTMTMSFQDASGLSHIGVVPEPAAAATLLAGLCLLGLLGLRRSNTGAR